MPYCHYWVKEYHSGAGKAHYLAHALTHVGLVAMDWTFAASTLSLAELAVVQTAVGIFKKQFAVIAQAAVPLFVTAIYVYHCRNGLLLTLNP
jgi:hypothetical protein